MQDKLQELMDKLYNEGLSKGRKDADELVAKAAREAEEIISNAKEKAAKKAYWKRKLWRNQRTRLDKSLSQNTLTSVKTCKNYVTVGLFRYTANV